MIIEIIRATLMLTFLVIGILGIYHSEFRFKRLIASLFVVWIMAGEAWTAVGNASTYTGDLGDVRKVGILTIVAAVIAIWSAIGWVTPDKEASA